MNPEHVSLALRQSHAMVRIVQHLLTLTGDHHQQASTISNATTQKLASQETNLHLLESVPRAMMASCALIVWVDTVAMVPSYVLSAPKLV